MKNHLLIGLGGTGGKIIRSLRKNVFQEFRTSDPDLVHLRYLYVDSSKEMMAIDDSSWRTLGESVQLSPRSQLLITGGNLNQMLDNLGMHPNVQPWIGSRIQWQDILNSIVGETLGGQKRRLGRFLFSCKSREFKDQLKQLATELSIGGDAGITFHVCCGLAGGTGSGSVVDVVSQIRALYRDSSRYRIVLYTLLPEEIPNPNWDTGNYHANGYAALTELNALSVGNYQPHDVAERGERLQLSDPFNGCYIFSNRNENGLQVDVDKTLSTIVADFLFQKIVAVRNAETSRLIEKIENAENGDGTAETSSGSTKPLRSKRFLTFGIKRLAVPEIEIREYLTYKFARQAALQLRFNNWDDTFGFRDEPRNQDFNEFVRDKQTLERWFLTDDHFTLSQGILLEEINNKSLKTIINEWLDIVPQFIGLVQNQNDKVWLNELEKLMAQRFEENFRKVGVRRFYETKIDARQDHVKELRRRIESELFDDWKNGIKSMHDISRCLIALITMLNERLVSVDDRVGSIKAKIDEVEQKVVSNRNEWVKIGVITQVLGKRNKLLDIHGETLRELYTARTQVEALAFAKRLLQDSVTEFNRLSTDVGLCAKLVDEAIKEFKERIDERCNDGDKPDLRQSLVRFYNAENVRLFARDLDKDKAEQSRQSQTVRFSLIELLSNTPSFSSFHNRINRQHFFDVLEQKCASSSVTAHNSLVASNRDRQPLLGVNIIGQLEREYSGKSSELRKFIHDLVEYAGNYLEFDSQAAVTSASKTKVSQFIVIMPVSSEYTEFSENLKHLFREHLRGGVPIEIIENDARPNEIILLSVTNLFPLRYVKATHFLKEKYDKRIINSDKPERIKLELHGEGDGSLFPTILIEDEKVLRERYLPSILIAKALDIITSITSSNTGITDFYLILQDSYGLPVRTKLGKTLLEVSETIEMEVAQKLEEFTFFKLEKEYSHTDQREELQKKIRDDLNQILSECRNDFVNPTYLRFETAARTAIQTIKIK